MPPPRTSGVNNGAPGAGGRITWLGMAGCHEDVDHMQVDNVDEAVAGFDGIVNILNRGKRSVLG